MTLQAKKTAILNAVQEFRRETSDSFDFGQPWNDENAKLFKKFTSEKLLPKVNETISSTQRLGNAFDELAEETDLIGEFDEEYVLLDSIPVNLDLSKDAELMLRRNYPQMATNFYGAGQHKKQKYTLNNNESRLSFRTIQDATKYAIDVNEKKISDINVDEEAELKAMFVQYANEHVKERREATSFADLASKVSKAILDIQDNTSLFNETMKVTGGVLGRYTTKSKLSDIYIITNNDFASYLLDTKLANTFNTAGIDFMSRIKSFYTLGGTFITTQDVTVEQKHLELLKAMGDYQVTLGDVILKGTVFTFDISQAFEPDTFKEIKPEGDLFALVIDKRAIRYKRKTKDMYHPPLLNGEFQEANHWLHYYSRKNISPFFNKILITGSTT